MVEMELAKNKEKDVTLVMKDGFFNPPSDEESDVVVSKEESIHTASRNKEKIKETKHENLRISTEINNAPTLGIVWSNNKHSLTPSDEESDAVVSKEENIHTASRNKEKIKETRHENLRVSTEMNNAPTLGIVWSNNKYSLTPSDEKVMRLFQKREAFILHQEIRKR